MVMREDLDTQAPAPPLAASEAKPHPVWACKTHRRIHAVLLIDDCAFCVLCYKNLLLKSLPNLKETETVCLGPSPK